MRKFLLLAAAAAMLFVSCNKENSGMDDSGIGGGRLIVITPQVSVTTRSAIDGSTLPDDRTILTSAYYNATEGASGNYFQKISFAKNGTSWKADKCWPQSGSLDLLAVSYDTLTVSNIVYGAKVSDSLSFDVPDNSVSQSDIMHGSAQGQTYSASGTPVVLGHAEAVLVWTAGATVAYDAAKNLGITINRVTLQNACYSGNLAVTAAEDEDSGYCRWTNLGSKKDLNLLNIGTGEDSLYYNVPATAMDIAATGNHMGIGGVGIIVPEQDQTSFVIYYTQHNGKDATGSARNTDLQYTYTCSGNWVEGKKYNYTISFNVNKIQVNHSIMDWVSEPSGITIPEPVAATYSINAGTAVNLPKAVLAENSEVMINWGDGSAEAFTNAADTKSTITADTLMLSHTYGSAFTGQASIVVRKGSVDFVSVSASELKKLEIVDKTKVKAEPDFLLSGVFTVNGSGKKVRFVRGNLMAYLNDDGTEVAEWKLADHQYDCIWLSSSTPISFRDAWFDKFGWTAAGKYTDGVKQYGINASEDYNDYIISWKTRKTDPVCDWGSLIMEGLTLLSDDEWHYLYQEHRAESDYICSMCQVFIDEGYDDTVCNLHKVAGMEGYLFMPDDYDGDIKDDYTAEEWAVAEKEGLVFLPTNGFRSGTEQDEDYHGFYLSSSYPDEDYYGRPIRLVWVVNE